MIPQLQERISHEKPSSNYAESNETLTEQAFDKNSVLCDKELACNPVKDSDQEDSADGGYGWVIVAAACLIQITGLGVGQGWGVMQDYYEQHNFLHNTIQLSFVGTITNILMNSLGPLTQVLLTSLSIRTVLFIAVCLCTIGLELASLSTQIWHLYLTQGLLYGGGASIIFYIAMSVVPEWFTRRRGIALAIASSGTCIGGLILPLIMTPLNNTIGVGWCYRILGLLSFTTGVLSCILFKEKEPKATTKPKLRDIVSLDVLRNPRFIIWCLTDIFMEAAYYVPFFYLPSYATYLGLTSSQGSLLVSLASLTNLLGRLAAGFIADRIGHINTIIIYGTITSLSCFLLWGLAKTFPMVVAFSVLFGFFGGSFITLTPAVTVIVTGMEKFQSGFSLFLLITILAMFGPNAAGGIEHSLNDSSFFSYKIFTGVGYLAGVLMLLVLKLSLPKGIFAKI